MSLALSHDVRRIHLLYLCCVKQDLYRLSGDNKVDFSPLDLDFVFSNCISLVEWPSRLPIEIFPPVACRLDVVLSIVPATDERRMTLRALGGSKWQERLRSLVREGFVDDLILENSDEETSKSI